MRRSSVIGLLVLLCACDPDTGQPPPKAAVPVDADALVAEQKRFLEREKRDIVNYLRRHDLPVANTATGVHVVLLRDLPGDTIRPQQWAAVNYRSELLDGTLVHASEPGRPEAFLVEMDEVESGLHEGIQHLSPGDSAVIVIPSHRAYGLIGDLDRIPMRATVVYHIGLVDIRNARR